MRNNVRNTVIIICFVIVSVVAFIRIVNAIQFSINCEQYLKRASDANTVENASMNLSKAIKYLEAHDLTNGIVSIFLHQPSNDIGYWYSNLKSALNELNSVKPEASQLEKTNILMKLRETLIDEGKGIVVTTPEGISIYPHNCVMFWIGTVSLVLMFLGLIALLIEDL